MLELAFQRQVEELLELYGWLYFHDRDSRRNRAGFPDVAAVRAPRLLFAELKGERGRVRPDQVRWLSELARVRQVETYLWRPSDFDAIHEALKR